jgi:fused signal recognition particle receptor
VRPFCFNAIATCICQLAFQFTIFHKIHPISNDKDITFNIILQVFIFHFSFFIRYLCTETFNHTPEMALFDIFKKKQASEAPSPQAPQQEREELAAGLEKTKQGLFAKLARSVAGRSRVDEGMLDELEEILITSDVGVETTVKIIERIEARVARDKYMNATELKNILREEIASLLEENEAGKEGFGVTPREGVPYVLMVVGVNGVGKTTTIGKLAAQLTRAGRKVYIGAADTFRAAAIEQLQVWADRAGATMIKQQMGSDPASVAFDTLKSAVANGADVVIIDTAGRLHNKVGLMNELTKIRNVMAKVIPTAPHEVMLVLDGSTGQNAFEQAREFTAATQVNSLAITKLDGTAKGGVVIGISDRFKVPVRYIGIGEGIDHLRVFNRREFVDALFGE